MLATSLPAIAAAFGESPVRLSFAITSYLFSLAVFIPISGWVADRYGARNVFRRRHRRVPGGSILCGLSSSLWQMVAARMLQGLGGAMMVPVGRLVLLRSVAKADLVRAMAWLTVPALIGPVIGPLLGGFITTYFHWRWIFWINVPIAILGLVLVTLFIPDAREPRPPPFDTAGFALTAVGLVGLMFGFETIGRDIVPGWASACCSASACVCILLYRPARRPDRPSGARPAACCGCRPSAPRSSAASCSGWASAPCRSCCRCCCRRASGSARSSRASSPSPRRSGRLTMKLAAKPILRRFGFRRVLLEQRRAQRGSRWRAIALFRPDTPHAVILAVLLIGGFFRSLQFTSINTLGYADIDQQRMSRATSFASMAQQLSLSVGVGTGRHPAAPDHGRARRRSTAGERLRAGVPGGRRLRRAVGLAYLRLPGDAGAEVSGHAACRAAPAQER